MTKVVNRKCRYLRVEGGFTLFEVVVAIALLGLILGAAFGLLGVGLRSMRGAQEYTRAVLLAKQKLYQASLGTVEPGMADGGSEGELRWTTEVVPDDGSGGELLAQVFQLRVKVSWGGGRAREKFVEMVTLFHPVDEEEPAASAPLPRGSRR